MFTAHANSWRKSSTRKQKGVALVLDYGAHSCISTPVTLAPVVCATTDA